jgi:hypothetical protein
MKILWIWCCLLSVTAQSQLNVESCIAFWKLTGKIRGGALPSPAEWDSVLQTPGYQRKNISAGRWKEFTDKVNFVFTPGNEAAAEERAAKDISYIPLLACLREEEKLKNYATNIQQSGFMDSALARARKNLPERYRNCFPVPTIYFVLYDYDGSGTNQHVIVDLLLSYHSDQCGTAIFAGHELYHNASSYCRIKQSRFKKNPSAAHRGIFIVANAISEEATADLIDKHQLIFGTGCHYLYRDTFIHYQQQHAAALLTKLGEALEKLASDQSGAEATMSYWMKMIPWAAHIPGTYISEVIRRNGFSRELIDHAHNAFKVFYLYNKAAAMDERKPPVFSMKAIRFLKKLEKKYIRS